MGASPISLSNELKCDVQIMVSLCFFAISFVLQRKAMLDGLEPLSYNAVRYAVSTLVLCCLKYIFKFEVRSEDAASEIEKRGPNHILSSDDRNKFGHPFRNLWLWALYLGLGNFGGSVLQQMGLVTVTAGKTGFITGMYVIFVPIAEYVLPHYQTSISWLVWFAALTSLFGLYLLSGCAEQHVCFGGAIGEGEMLVFISMLFWVTNIIVADVCAKEMEIIFLQLLEFVIVTVLTALLVLIVQPEINLQLLTQHWLPIIAVGCTEAIAFTLSTMGQIYSTPSHAAVLYSLEAVVCALFSFIFLGETLTTIELGGTALMFVAALISSFSSSSNEDSEDDGNSSHNKGEDSEPIFASNVNFGSIKLSNKQPNIV